MATVQELLKLIMEPPEAGLPDTIYDDLNASYTDEVSGFTSAAESSAAEYEAVLAAKDAEISQLKAANYDLLMEAQASTGEVEGDVDADGDGVDNEDEDDANISIDDLYKDSDEDDEDEGDDGE